MNVFVILITFLSIFSLTGALDCYKCDNCEKPTETTENCGLQHDITGARCEKRIDSNGVVSRGCTNKALCTANTLFSECVPGDELDCFTCCAGDLCNSATNRMPTTATTFIVFLITTAILRILK